MTLRHYPTFGKLIYKLTAERTGVSCCSLRRDCVGLCCACFFRSVSSRNFGSADGGLEETVTEIVVARRMG